MKLEGFNEMTQKMSITMSDLTARLLISRKPKGLTRSEWVEELIRLGLAAVSQQYVIIKKGEQEKPLEHGLNVYDFRNFSSVKTSVSIY